MKFPSKKSRHEFMEAMGPERMAEMWKVRRNLAEINRRMMAKWEVEGRMEPSAMLAQAMAMEEQREERKAKGGGISQMNSAIGDFLYQANDTAINLKSFNYISERHPFGSQSNTTNVGGFGGSK
jgi:hypothetical protein